MKIFILESVEDASYDDGSIVAVFLSEDKAKEYKKELEANEDDCVRYYYIRDFEVIE